MPNGFVNVKDFGAVGDGVHDDTAAIQSAFDAAYGSSGSPHGGLSSAAILNQAVVFPNGNYIISSPINITQVQGGWLIGAGKMATKITNISTGSSRAGTVFRTNGMDFSLIENMTIVAAPSGAGTINYGFDLAWDKTGTVSLHADTFRNVRFEGGDVGCAIGDGGNMGSEILFVGCDFVGCQRGTIAFNFNALDMTLLGGSFQNCGIGIDCNTTSTYSYLSGITFSGSSTVDILFDDSDGMVADGCTSTSSVGFLEILGSAPMHSRACSYIPSSGTFTRLAQTLLIMDGCLATNSVLQSSVGSSQSGPIVPNAVYLRGNSFPANFISGATNIPSSIIKENL